jgi:PhoH-like ATPase
VIYISSADKIFVLDTNILLLDPFSIFSFEENEVIIPLTVIEEVDNIKERQDSSGFNARQVSRNLDELRNGHKLSDGVKLSNGGVLTVFTDSETRKFQEEYVPFINSSKEDNRILATAKYMNEKRDKKVALVSNDMNMRIKADALGLNANDYKKNKVDLAKINTGFYQTSIKEKYIDNFFIENELPTNLLDEEITENLYPNKFVQFQNNSKSMIGRFNKSKNKIVPFIFEKYYPSGIEARNTEQKMALELLLNDNIKIVTLSGKAGTGKTLLALACGLYKTTDKDVYSKMSVARPLMPMGKEMGYLPGDKDEKLDPWMKPIYDNLEILINNKDQEVKESSIELLKQMGILEVEALSYIRGRSIPNNFIIIDEAQNLSPHEVKTIVTRVGKNSKIVFTGDIEQIDSPYLDKQSNGLIYLAEKFKDKEIAGHINLVKGERSKLAEMASQIL